MFQVLTQEGWVEVHTDLMDSVSLVPQIIVAIYFYLFHFIVNGVSASLGGIRPTATLSWDCLPPTPLPPPTPSAVHAGLDYPARLSRRCQFLSFGRCKAPHSKPCFPAPFLQSLP